MKDAMSEAIKALEELNKVLEQAKEKAKIKVEAAKTEDPKLNETKEIKRREVSEGLAKIFSGITEEMMKQDEDIEDVMNMIMFGGKINCELCEILFGDEDEEKEGKE